MAPKLNYPAWTLIAIFFGLLTGVVGLSSVGWSQELKHFPYTAFAVRDGVKVYSGPGEVHYPTAELNQGTLIEVYRHDPNDWCAIRPVDNSFSLIPAESIERTSDSAGVAKADGTQVWVGTQLGPVEKPLWQIKLKKGEAIEILGEISYPTEEGFSTNWLQVAPPPGEFRWVKRSDLLLPDDSTSDSPRSNAVAKSPSNLPDRRSIDGVVDELSDTAESNEFGSQQATYVQQVLDDPFAGEREAIRTNSSDNLGWRRATKPFQPQSTNAMATSDRLTRPHPAPFDQTNTGATIPSVSRSYDSVIPSPSLSVDLGPLTERLQTVDLELASEIIKPAETWDLDRFSRDLVEIQSRSSSSLERNQAMQLIQKLDRLRETKNKLISAGQVGRGTLNGLVGTGIESSVQYGTTYDAYGWLNELVQNNGRGEPSYVLQDDQGKIIFEIEPAPGLNLHRYLTTKIGVIGSRGYNQRLKLNHVVADRVVVLEKTRR